MKDISERTIVKIRMLRLFFGLILVLEFLASIPLYLILGFGLYALIGKTGEFLTFLILLSYPVVYFISLIVSAKYIRQGFFKKAMNTALAPCIPLFALITAILIIWIINPKFA